MSNPPRRWLVRLPGFVAKDLFARVNDGPAEALLGRVEIDPTRVTGPDKTPQMRLLLETTKDVPKAYELTPRESRPPMVVLVGKRPAPAPPADPAKRHQPAAAAELAIEGDVDVFLDMRPSLADASYANVLEDRLDRQRDRLTAQKVDTSGQVAVTPQMVIAQQHEQRKAVERKRAPRERLVATMDREGVRAKMFEAFDRQQYYGFVELETYLKQPRALVRSVLAEIAVTSKTGPHANKWTLKPEYRTSTDASLAAAAAEAAAAAAAAAAQPPVKQ